MAIPLILASASPARLATLRSAGVEPTVRASDVDEPAVVQRAETDLGRLDAEDVALLLAKAKCESVATAVAEDDSAPEGLIVGCDSVLALDGETLGKPADASDAVDRWRRMSGRTGVLHTGHWVIDDREDGTGATFGAVASTTVHFADLSAEEIDAYVATGEPLHVAGAFAIDGLGGAYVRGIEGDYHNVVGISLPLLREMLAEIDVVWHELLT
ncbi:Maf family protein [Luteipulveratus sp. YIM 133132]|uniref:Nucleoside triphosphate pyrophosphatase n=1 Tax=Luteipulveratus flavus TaxID=3031728 RepID=A0ABT6C2M5_9MICO|nr:MULTISPECIES: Maf family protein [unclassified Luteipulveratus]MDE9367018.1 Maf family protein [Luteipulveratus sp. YIM 133132]MDF8263003.1 Maf family protein [Luteipulveratus sp. YIM 133296]